MQNFIETENRFLEARPRHPKAKLAKTRFYSSSKSSQPPSQLRNAFGSRESHVVPSLCY
ncbi:hypothetical protein MPNT_320015 [Candidatus Methylacidithermus pantelleriae]|uniref:Uncharacterized protein n=1 Tax=Candidatus Methylacidithermus pantelleriae TaxID=2744239 RepID=A0A8J2FSP1_9BACT|nr:hypothetical protein MPNT_320015 [Candidatus Methylacidithermus pantelleriae]